MSTSFSKANILYSSRVGFLNYLNLILSCKNIQLYNMHVISCTLIKQHFKKNMYANCIKQTDYNLGLKIIAIYNFGLLVSGLNLWMASLIHLQTCYRQSFHTFSTVSTALTNVRWLIRTGFCSLPLSSKYIYGVIYTLKFFFRK